MSVIINSVWGTFAAILQAFQKLQYASVGSVITSLVTLCGIVIAITLKIGVVGFAYVYLIASAITLAYFCTIYAQKWHLPRLEIDGLFWKSTLKEAWPMAAMAMSAIIYFRIDVVILSLIQGAAAVGLYSAAYTLSETSTMIPSLFMAALFPVLSKLHKDSKESFADTCAQSIRYLLYLGVPMAFFITLWAKPIVICSLEVRLADPRQRCK